MRIGSNPSLVNLNGIENITNIGYGLFIVDNDLLTNLNELINITSINTTLSIAENSALVNLSGLQNITIIGVDLLIVENDNLTNLNELSNLNSAPNIRINNNNILVDFCGLNNVIVNGGNNDFLAFYNAYNPTKQDIIDGNCSL